MIVCAGEVLVDIAEDGREHDGGAPANVAFHAASLGVPCALISRIGRDERGRGLRSWLENAGIGTAALQEDKVLPTGAVHVKNVQEGPVYDIVSPAAWDAIEDSADSVDAVRHARVVVFGTLAQRAPVSRAAIRRLVTQARECGAVVLADLNLRPPFFDDETIHWTLRHCDVLKLNRNELHTVSRLLGARGDDNDLFAGLLREFGIARGILTCGAGGAWIFEEGELSHTPAVAVAVEDTVGAGDAFCAVVAMALVLGLSLRAAALSAAEVAAFVAGCPGATPQLPEELRARVQRVLR